MKNLLKEYGREKKVGIHWSRQCGVLNISQPYRSPPPVKGIALLLHNNRKYILIVNFCTTGSINVAK
jgi:hypothetical protein